MIQLYIFSAAFGLVVGSFLNVCIHRLPRGESIVWPSSHCPHCGSRIRSWENIPLLSYLFLLGRCRSCRRRISLRYPAVEALNALLYVGLLWRYGPGWHSLLQFALVSSLLVITFIDLDHQIIPDAITLPGAALGLLAGWALLPDPFARAELLGFLNSVGGAAGALAVFYVIAVVSRGGMGGGDIKFMAMVGAWTGWKGAFLTTFAGSLAGSFIGLGLMIFAGAGRRAKVPFGPFLAIGVIITLFYGQEIFGLYWHGYR